MRIISSSSDVNYSMASTYRMIYQAPDVHCHIYNTRKAELCHSKFCNQKILMVFSDISLYLNN